ncbi:hypothetical protein K440DRAFT_636218 [Wilcoxina mikolae CBS 423.85]|nr:hypothetical protein K440DRAFT_636218 [Wilcoxina mikolae CBS 423.85]
MSSAKTPQSAPRRWFVLIGIDFYIPGTNRRDEYGRTISFHTLRGCVCDVMNVKNLIEKKFKKGCYRIATLTSTSTTYTKEPKEKLPTYDNIIRSLRKVSDDAEAGDLVYIHYSGHGARVRETYKGTNAVYKAIVPLDIACGGKYILDVELSELLDDMVNRQLIVTVVLDCCHSGGGTARNLSSQLSDCRGIEQIDATAGAQLGTSGDDVQEWSTPAVSHQAGSGRRSGGECRVGTQNLQGYELLAACSLNEKAFERFYDGMWQGVLTYYLLNSLWPDVNITHGMLYRRIVTKVNGYSNKQTPIFKGDGQRYFFSNKRFDGPCASPFTVRRMHLHNDKRQYPVLDVGAAHSMLKGSELTVYPWDVTDFRDSNRYPKIRVIEVWPLESMAEVIDHQTVTIEPGCQAILLKPLVVELKVKSSEFPEGVKFMQLKTEISSRPAQSPLERVVSGVKVVPYSDDSADYHVKVENDQYKLLNTKNQSIRHFPSSNDPVLFHYNLGHLSKFEMFRTLENANVPQSLKGKFKFTLKAVGESAILEGESKCSVKEHTKISFKFENNSRMDLNVTILDFGPLWNIEQIFPPDMDSFIVEAGQCMVFEEEFDMYVPDKWDRSSWGNPVDWFKAFITSLPTSFRSLELSKLSNDVAVPGRHTTSADIDLERLLDYLNTMDASNDNSRPAKLSPGSRGKCWATAEIEIPTVRRLKFNTPTARCIFTTKNSLTDMREDTAIKRSVTVGNTRGD